LTSKSKTNGGKVFEDNWKKSYAKLPIYYLRLQDAVKWGRGEGSNFTPSNPYDSLQFKIPFLWLLELKSTIGTNVSFNPIKPWGKPENKKTQVMIKANQVKDLMEAVKKDGIIAGFIINFREHVTKTKVPITLPDETFFIHINDFIKFAVTSEKSSLNREECASIGMRIESHKLKVNYTYGVKKFSEESPEFYLKKGHLNRMALEEAYEWLGELLKVAQ
jgi:hypothetical protein